MGISHIIPILPQYSDELRYIFAFLEFSMTLLAELDPLLQFSRLMEQEASRIIKSPRQGRLRYRLYLYHLTSRPQQPYDSNIIIFLILQTRELSYRSFNNLSQITQLVSTRPNICTLWPVFFITHRAYSFISCIPRLCASQKIFN